MYVYCVFKIERAKVINNIEGAKKEIKMMFQNFYNNGYKKLTKDKLCENDM